MLDSARIMAHCVRLLNLTLSHKAKTINWNVWIFSRFCTNHSKRDSLINSYFSLRSFFRFYRIFVSSIVFFSLPHNRFLSTDPLFSSSYFLPEHKKTRSPSVSENSTFLSPIVFLGEKTFNSKSKDVLRYMRFLAYKKTYLKRFCS